MDAFEILVIILSITLAIFLVLAIIATSYVIKILKRVDNVSEHIESVAANIESASDKFRQAAGPAAMATFVAKIFNNKDK